MVWVLESWGFLGKEKWFESSYEVEIFCGVGGGEELRRQQEKQNFQQFLLAKEVRRGIERKGEVMGFVDKV